VGKDCRLQRKTAFQPVISGQIGGAQIDTVDESPGFDLSDTFRDNDRGKIGASGNYGGGPAVENDSVVFGFTDCRCEW
jgi:hypothetical protein